jgi:hypothetical protein
VTIAKIVSESGKPCKDCLQWKNLSEFYARAASKDGRMTRCKTCWNGKYAPRIGFKDGKPTRAGHVRVSAGERAFIWLAMPEFTTGEIAEVLRRSEHTVTTVRRDLYRQMVRAVAKGAPNAFARFEVWEEAFVRLAYPEFPAAIVAKVLGRTKAAVKSYASRILKLNKRTSRSTPRISRRYYTSIQAGAKARQLVFQVNLDYIDNLLIAQQGKCALSGLPISFPGKGGTASLDRKDSSVGYIEGNLHWVHRDINRMKLDYPLAYFVQLCEAVVKQSRRRCRRPKKG